MVGREGIGREDHRGEHDDAELLAMAVALIGIAGVSAARRPVLERLARWTGRNRAVARVLLVSRERVLG
ncbi:hypothetical protein GOFOIKOB_5870 [Methylobacterium tardum]|nr:hypothetical protein GOFOIKOB_5870 [Methylobacterium tardum]